MSASRGEDGRTSPARPLDGEAPSRSEGASPSEWDRAITRPGTAGLVEGDADGSGGTSRAPMHVRPEDRKDMKSTGEDAVMTVLMR